jgi:N-acetylmuramoyl-L-alanine amidase
MPQLPRELSHVALLRPLGGLLIAVGLLTAQSAAPHRVTGVRFWTLGDVTRVAVETDGKFEVLSDHLSDPERVFFDLTGTRPQLGDKTHAVIPVDDKLIQQIRVAESRKNVTRVVLDLKGVADVSTSQLENPHRLIIEVWQPGHMKAPAAPPVPQLAVVALDAAAAPHREHRAFRPPPTKLAARAKPPQVVLFTPPPMEVKPPMSFALNARLAVPFPSVSTPPVFLAEPLSAPKSNFNASARSADLKHLPDPNQPEMGPPAYPTPHASAPKPTVESANAEAAEFTAKPVASVTMPPSPPETTLTANHSGDAVAVDKPVAKRASGPTVAAADSALPAKRNSTGDRSMIRVLGLKVGRIVIDAGHGGHDTGTVGPEGLREKDLVLDVSKRLGALIEDRMGSEVVYTRSDDTFVALERRTEIANEAKADLFLSIHANSSPIRTAAGVETYYLSFTTSKTALDLAARENAASSETVYDLQDILQKIALNDKVDESRDFAARVQTALFALSAKNNKNSKDRGIRKAPFVVLIGANMPSVLAEIGFISNAHDESTMKKQEYRERIAEALYKGVSGYASTLSHFQVAQRRPGASE